MKEVKTMCMKSNLANFVARELLFDGEFADMVMDAKIKYREELNQYFNKVLAASGATWPITLTQSEYDDLNPPVDGQIYLIVDPKNCGEETRPSGYSPEEEEVLSQYDPRRRF